MSKERITIDTIASGQPRPYADSLLMVRVTFEHIHPFLGGDLQNNYMDASSASTRLKRLGVGYIETKIGERKHGLDSYLSYLKPIDPKVARDVMKYTYGDPDRVVSHIWEFYIVQPFCD